MASDIWEIILACAESSFIEVTVFVGGILLLFGYIRGKHIISCTLYKLHPGSGEPSACVITPSRPRDLPVIRIEIWQERNFYELFSLSTRSRSSTSSGKS
jgi:hypothetical protein